MFFLALARHLLVYLMLPCYIPAARLLTHLKLVVVYEPPQDQAPSRKTQQVLIPNNPPPVILFVVLHKAGTV